MYRLLPAPLWLAIATGCAPALVLYPDDAQQLRMATPSTTVFQARSYGMAAEVAFVGDLDGDGLEDAVVTDLACSSADDTIVYLLYGVKGGFGAQALLPTVGVALVAPQTRLGRAIPAGDVDGDGFDDFFIGEPDDDGSWAGSHDAMWLVRGGARSNGGLLADHAILFELPGSSAAFGAAAGDLDGSGLPDLVIGSRDAGGDKPRLWVFLDPILPAMGSVVLSDADLMMHTLFSERIAIADLDGDGANELISGGFSGLGPAGAEVFAADDLLGQPLWRVTSAHTMLGWQLALGDVNDDDVDDLVLSDPYASGPGGTGLGAVYGFNGGQSRTGDLGADAADWTVWGNGGEFGYALALGAADGSGTVFAGATGGNGGRGEAWLLKAGPVSVKEPLALMGGERRGATLDVLGASVALGDLDGDGLTDALVSAPTNAVGDRDGGRIYLYSAVRP